jgi:hypothetical protein
MRCLALLQVDKTAAPAVKPKAKIAAPVMPKPAAPVNMKPPKPAFVLFCDSRYVQWIDATFPSANRYAASAATFQTAGATYPWSCIIMQLFSQLHASSTSIGFWSSDVTLPPLLLLGLHQSQEGTDQGG